MSLSAGGVTIPRSQVGPGALSRRRAPHSHLSAVLVADVARRRRRRAPAASSAAARAQAASPSPPPPPPAPARLGPPATVDARMYDQLVQAQRRSAARLGEANAHARRLARDLDRCQRDLAAAGGALGALAADAQAAARAARALAAAARHGAPLSHAAAGEGAAAAAAAAGAKPGRRPTSEGADAYDDWANDDDDDDDGNCFGAGGGALAAEAEALARRLGALASGASSRRDAVSSGVARAIPVEWVGIASEVRVMGDFDGWTRGVALNASEDDGGGGGSSGGGGGSGGGGSGGGGGTTFCRFTGQLRLRPGEHRVKLLVDGEWRMFGGWPEADDGRGNAVNVLTVGGPGE